MKKFLSILIVVNMFCGLAKGDFMNEGLGSLVRKIEVEGTSISEPWLCFRDSGKLDTEELKTIVFFCKKNPDIKGLLFEFNGITAADAEILMRWLGETETNVKSLVFIENRLEEEGIRKVAHYLDDNHILDRLVIDEPASRVFEDVGFFCRAELKELYLGNPSEYDAFYDYIATVPFAYYEDTFLASLIRGLRNNSRLTKIAFREAPIRMDSESANALLDLAKRHPEEVILMGCFNPGITPEYLESLLKNFGHFTTLDLSNNKTITSDHLELLLNDKLCPIKHLRLASCGIVIDAKCAEKLEEILKNNKTLESLDLSGNSIGVCGAKALRTVLRKSSTLNSLDLISSEINVEGAKMLFEGLKNNQSLIRLNLAYNEIGSEGAKVLSEALKTKIRLEKLFLASNKIGNEGTKMIVEALDTDTCLKQLDLTNNEIGDEGAEAIAEVLKTNRAKLEQLFLDWNEISPEGDESILIALKTNNTLHQINLSCCTAISLKHLSEIAFNNKVLKILAVGLSLDISCYQLNMTRDEFEQHLRGLLGKNPTQIDFDTKMFKFPEELNSDFWNNLGWSFCWDSLFL